MATLKRGFAMAAIAALMAAFAPAAASAAITPDPYSTSGGTGRMSLNSILGPSSCNLSAIVASATGTPTGATGTITGYTASGCSGIVTAARFSRAMPFSISSGAVTLNFSILKTNITGGLCLYAGTLRGTIPRNVSTFTVSGTKSLTQTLSGFCDSSFGTSVTITLPGSSITWP